MLNYKSFGLVLGLSVLACSHAYSVGENDNNNNNNEPAKPTVPLIKEVSSEDNITNISSVGSLTPTHEIGCIPVSEVKSYYTPADLLEGVKKAKDTESDINNAARLFTLARIYGAFDTLRVKDKTSHDAIMNMLMSTNMFFVSKGQEALFSKIGEKSSAILKDDKSRSELKQAVETLGKPTYHPDYMILHGMGSIMRAFEQQYEKKTSSNVQQSNGLIENFDAEKAWKDVLAGFDRK